MGDFNIKFLNCNTDKDSSDYIDILCFHSFYPTVNSPAGIITTTKTLVDIIFYHNTSKNIPLGYVATSITNCLTISTSIQPHCKGEKVISQFWPKDFWKIYRKHWLE